MNLSIINMGCISERAMEKNLISKMNMSNITRVNSLENSDYLLYITCSGVGDTIKDVLRDMQLLNIYSIKHDVKVIVVGCLVINHEYLFNMFKNNSNMKFINDREWVIPVINYISDLNKRNTYNEKLNNRFYSFDKNDVSAKFMLEEGCTNKCSFCKIHYNEKDKDIKSMPFELALEYLNNKINTGTRCISLGGTNLTLYGLDLYGKKRLHEFIFELSKNDNLDMIRIDELVPGDMYDELLKEIINNPKIVSTSIQLESASDRLLKLMNRNYMLEEYDAYSKKIIDSGKYISTILMSGFPTENIDDMNITIKYLSDRGIIPNGVCEYSDFKYIPSSNLAQLSKNEKRQHTLYLRNSTREIRYNIFLNNMSLQNKLIYICKSNGYHYFKCSIPMINIVSKKNIYDSLEPGVIIDETPKKLIKKSSITNDITYKI